MFGTSYTHTHIYTYINACFGGLIGFEGTSSEKFTSPVLLIRFALYSLGGGGGGGLLIFFPKVGSIGRSETPLSVQSRRIKHRKLGRRNVHPDNSARVFLISLAYKTAFEHEGRTNEGKETRGRNKREREKEGCRSK